MNLTPIKSASAFIPLAMSLSAIVLVIGHYALYGIVYEPDEGTAAHIYQILMAGQVPLVAFFAIRWLPARPRPALVTLSVQAVAWLSSIAALHFFVEP